jgi:hypothetical protein
LDKGGFIGSARAGVNSSGNGGGGKLMSLVSSWRGYVVWKSPVVATGIRSDGRPHRCHLREAGYQAKEK